MWNIKTKQEALLRSDWYCGGKGNAEDITKTVGSAHCPHDRSKQQLNTQIWYCGGRGNVTNIYQWMELKDGELRLLHLRLDTRITLDVDQEREAKRRKTRTWRWQSERPWNILLQPARTLLSKYPKRPIARSIKGKCWTTLVRSTSVSLKACRCSNRSQ